MSILTYAHIARNILLLSLILDDVNGANEKSIWNLFYHFRVDKGSLDLLQKQATRLLSLSTSLASWHTTQYGQQVRICDPISLERVREVWAFYGAKREGADLISYKRKVESSIAKSQEHMKARLGKIDSVITGFRSAQPACIEAIRDLGSLYKDYWKFGTTDTKSAIRSLATEYNPMFAPQNENMSLHYGTDPLLGFHLGASYAPIKPPSPLSNSSHEKPKPQEIVLTAKREFNSWMYSFRSHYFEDLVTLRFFVGDAVAFAYTLQHVKTTGSPKHANWYRDRYHFEPLELSEDEYVGGSAPFVFDIIDTSNLIDHLGALNLLTATSPLLRNKLAATLYSENLVRTQTNHQEILENILCGDLATVSSLLGLTPVEVATNAAPFSSGDEALYMSTLDSSEATQLFARIAWKRPPNPTGATEKALSPMHFDPSHLGHVLYRIYLNMFADEDITQLFARMRTRSSQTASFPTYHRGSFVAFLSLVKSRSRTDWIRTMEAFLLYLEEADSLSFSNSYDQELFLWMHMMGIYSVAILQNPPGSSVVSSQATGILQQWPDIPAVVCVTLRVPRSQLDLFIKKSIEKHYTPPLQGVMRSSSHAKNQWQNMFSATQIGFGHLVSKGSQHSDSREIEVNEDNLGWYGKSSMFVSFYVPSWTLLQEPRATTVSLALIHSPPTVAHFLTSLGVFLTVFSVAQEDTEYVYITRNPPHQKGAIYIGGFTQKEVKNEVGPQAQSKTTVTATVDKNTGHISSFTSHIQILSEDAKSILKNGCKVSSSMQSPFNYTLSLEKRPEYRANFPLPILGSTTRVRIARKSSYLELVADVAKSNDWSTFRSFMYPVFMDSECPVSWNMPHLNLPSLPVIDVTNSSSVRLKWLGHHLPTMWSAQESALRFDPSLPASPNLRAKVEFKESLFHMFMGYTGVQGKKASMFAIDCTEEEGVQMLFFVSNMRLDLSNRTVVLDAAVLPLRIELMGSILPSLRAMMGSSHAVITIRTPKNELRIWKEALPAWVERSRSWSHKASCEYLATGKIPISTGFGERILCSCGEGELPANFMPSFPGWENLAKHAVRLSISPSFSSALVDNPITISDVGGISTAPVQQEGGCLVCGKLTKPDGSNLKTCARCHEARYCSRGCQRTDWKKHKVVCKASAM